MNSSQYVLKAPGTRHRMVMACREAMQSARFWVYLSSSVVALAISFSFGKDVMWDTPAYHLYAGFSALHDRFGQDYFPAGTQTYFNPYVYVPYFLLVRSGMPALAVSSVLALLQSGILWLTYELALLVAPVEDWTVRVKLGVCAAALACANPILINQIGTSYVDVITAEIVLAAWLLLVRAVRAPGVTCIIGAGFLLGAVSALKLTNSVHAVAAWVPLLFIPATLRGRIRYAAGFGLAMAAGFAITMAPWSIRLEQHFGSPVFPLLNSLFHAPQFPTTSLRDSRFIPNSLADALSRPFAIATPVPLVDDEFAAPDLRYAVLLVLVLLAVGLGLWRRYKLPQSSAGSPQDVMGTRALAALGAGLLLDWILWLIASGNGRYFIAMACVTAVLVVGLVFRLFAAYPKTRGYLLLAILGVQVFQLCEGATYRDNVRWDGGPPFEVSIPNELTAQPYLYLTMGEQSMSFLAPFLAPTSGLVDLDGDYVLGPRGANGEHLKWLIGKYAPHIRVVVLDNRVGTARGVGLPDATHVNDTLAQFGLHADGRVCSEIEVKNVGPRFRDVLANTLPIRLPQLDGKIIKVPVSPNWHLAACQVVSDTGAHTALFAGERRADFVFDRVEAACPRLFQPSGPVTENYGDERRGYHWLRRYASTSLAVMIVGGAVKVFDPLRGGLPAYLGRESDWETGPPRLACGFHDGHYYVKVLHR